MDEREREFIRLNQPELLRLIICNTVLISHLQQKNTISDFEVAEIDSIPNRFEKTKKLLEILVVKLNGYDSLILALEKANQSGALKILQGLIRNAPACQVTLDATPRFCVTPEFVHPAQEHSSTLNVSPSGSVMYHLRFEAEQMDVQNVVLMKLTPKFVNAMGSTEVNLQIILELGSLLLFDRTELQELQSSNYRTERQRITQLFGVIGNIGPTGIIKCLEKLCNLTDLPRHSERFREIISSTFPGSVVGP